MSSLGLRLVQYKPFVALYLTVGTLTDDFALLLALINGSLGAAGWLIVMTIGVVIVEIIAIVLVLINVQGTAKLVLGILVSSALILNCFVISSEHLPTACNCVHDNFKRHFYIHFSSPAGNIVQYCCHTLLPCYWCCVCCICKCMGRTTRCMP